MFSMRSRVVGSRPLIFLPLDAFAVTFFYLEKVLSKSVDGRPSGLTPHIFRLFAWTHKWSWQDAISVKEREVPGSEVK